MKTQRPITAWIVEDVDKDALDAAETMRAVAKEAGLEVELYWDSTLLWDSLLSGPPPGKYQPEFNKTEHPPTIVILDLFGPAGFLGRDFLSDLREFEDSASNPRSWVVLYSVYTGFDEAQDLIHVEPTRDRKVVFSGSKQPAVLREKLARCLRSWKEDNYL